MMWKEAQIALLVIQRESQLGYGMLQEDQVISPTFEAEKKFKNLFHHDVMSRITAADQLRQCYWAVRKTAREIIECSETKILSLFELKQSRTRLDLHIYLYRILQELERMDRSLFLILRNAQKALCNNIQRIVIEHKKLKQVSNLKKIDLKLANFFERLSVPLSYSSSEAIKVTCLHPDDVEHQRCRAGVLAAANRSYFSGSQYDNYRISCIVKLQHERQKQLFQTRNDQGRVKGLFCSLEPDAVVHTLFFGFFSLDEGSASLSFKKKFDLGDPAKHVLQVYLQFSESAFTPTLPVAFSRMSTLVRAIWTCHDVLTRSTECR
eukprot:745975-Hanusia_phi.AAC.3